MCETVQEVGHQVIWNDSPDGSNKEECTELNDAFVTQSLCSVTQHCMGYLMAQDEGQLCIISAGAHRKINYKYTNYFRKINLACANAATLVQVDNSLSSELQ